MSYKPLNRKEAIIVGYSDVEPKSVEELILSGHGLETKLYTRDEYLRACAYATAHNIPVDEEILIRIFGGGNVEAPLPPPGKLNDEFK